ncbi:hypothetical protein [Oleiagrimonas sp.]|jgi:hypothetical protein|uniref:hypothetical protein n=1 Tax=Oleiagrimonas sp. TaxID=2010330 RepID=UPI002610F9EE|nr:hypothetical protein [Oleiagrimonas sp.]MDA3913540.1 hypothetical protein [Oleiagrimonas sp.]
MLFDLMLVAALAAASSPGAVSRFVGIAQASENGPVIYRERHYRYRENGHRRALVLYVCPDGKPFARKIDGGGSGTPQAPDFELNDARNGYREGVRTVDGQRQVFVHRVGAEQTMSAALPKADQPVIDSGFGVFLHRHWAALMSGKTVDLSFLVPSRRKFMGFEVSRHQDAAADKKGEVVFRLRLSSWFGFALPHIDVAYAADSRQLRWFRGLSNIRDMHGKNITAFLRYPEALRESDVGASAVARASSVALDGRCSLH